MSAGQRAPAGVHAISSHILNSSTRSVGSSMRERAGVSPQNTSSERSYDTDATAEVRLSRCHLHCSDAKIAAKNASTGSETRSGSPSA